jgi:hypothetical protein
MQSRCLKVVMILLILVQPVASLASACAMLSGSGQQALAAMSAVDSSMSYENLPADTEHQRCHESVAPTETDSDKCKSCMDGASCATACSIASSVLPSAFYSGDIAPSHAPVESFNQSLCSQYPSELYRPPRLS